MVSYWPLALFAAWLFAVLQLAGLSSTWRQHGVSPLHRRAASRLHSHAGESPSVYSAPDTIQCFAVIDPLPQYVAGVSVSDGRLRPFLA